jgi:hypothetical protein
MSDDYLDWETQLAREIVRCTEAKLIERVEALEGRVPTNDEIKRYGARGIHPDGREEWKWRGITILIVEPPTCKRPSWLFT